MGLDIFFYRFTSNNDDIKTIQEENDKKAIKNLKDFFKRRFAKLVKLNYGSEEYTVEWCKMYEALKKYTNYPEWNFDKLKSPISLDDAKPIADSYVKRHYKQYDAYFRKVNFVYAYFQPRLERECCFVTKEDCEDLIDRCKRILKDHSLAKELLPTQGGFFFGSTCYDEWYYNDCKECIKEMKKLLKGWKNNEKCYVVMSW